MKIFIVTQYQELCVHYNTWANEEARIDWRTDFYRGTRCTVAFAATELKKHLEAILKDCEICYADRDNDDDTLQISLITQRDTGKECGYTLKPIDKGIQIIGETRVGVLYGVYELLKLQGYRWFSPDEAGQHTPPAADHLVILQNEQNYTPAMDLGRGFDFEGFLPGNSMWLWMARNRLNVCRPQPGCEAYQNKMGMIFKCGGHIFEWILSPDCILEDGRTVWEAHREWYGIPKNGAEITPQNAIRTQFCVSKEDLCEYLSKTIIEKLKGEWIYADRLDIWGFDTWGSTCCCPDCLKKGNNSDGTLYFTSKLREALNQVDLGRSVQLVMCAYGGTATLEPPENPIPQNLIDAGDLLVFYPITRCYRHHLDETPCKENEYFQDCLTGWLSKTPAMPIIMGEYYDCSKFEEIPAVLTQTMCYDITKYCEMGVRGITYMHVPVSSWGVKSITQWIYSNLSFEPFMDQEQLLNDYFDSKYGMDAQGMRIVYAKLEEALKDIQSWRSWSPRSILSQFQMWNGGVPKTPLDSVGHYDGHSGIIAAGKRTVTLLEEARDIIMELKRKYYDSLPEVKEVPLALNPGMLGVLNCSCDQDFRLGEDLRLINYGMDAMGLMTAVAEYYNALYEGKESGGIWDRVTELYQKLDGYFTCISNNFAYFGGICPSGLKRTQMEAVVRRCASYRKNHTIR